MPDAPRLFADDRDYLLWDAVSAAWTEVGMFESEYLQRALELRALYRDWDAVERRMLRDAVAFFAPMTLLMTALAFVPVLSLFAVAMLPDWGFDEDWLRRKVARWHARPYWLHWCNPLRVLGYPLAWLWSIAVRRQLKRAWIATGPDAVQAR